MSQDKTVVSNVVGPVNIKSRLDRVTQNVMNAPAAPPETRAQMAQLLQELQGALGAAEEKKPEDSERIVKTAELVAAEVTKENPDKSFLSITVEGLKQAAKAVEDIAPQVLAVAGKIAAFVAGLAS